MSKLSKKLQKFADCIIVETRPSGEKFYTLDYNNPRRDKYQPIVYKCHMDMMPNDYAYDVIATVLDQMIEHLEYNSDLDDYAPDVNGRSNNALQQITDHYSYYIDEILGEYNPGDWYNLLVAANERFYNEVSQIILSEL